MILSNHNKIASRPHAMPMRYIASYVHAKYPQHAMYIAISRIASVVNAIYIACWHPMLIAFRPQMRCSSDWLVGCCCIYKTTRKKENKPREGSRATGKQMFVYFRLFYSLQRDYERRRKRKSRPRILKTHTPQQEHKRRSTPRKEFGDDGRSDSTKRPSSPQSLRSAVLSMRSSYHNLQPMSDDQQRTHPWLFHASATYQLLLTASAAFASASATT